MYKYFVSFSFKKNSGIGFGNIDVSLSGRIQSRDDILGIADIIAKENGIIKENIVILNYILWGD